MTRGFAVFSATCADQARTAVEESDPELAILSWPLADSDGARLLADLHERRPEIRSLVLAERLDVLPENVIADDALLKGSCTPAQIVDRAKALTARKRGPKKTVQAIDRMMVLAERRIA